MEEQLTYQQKQRKLSNNSYREKEQPVVVASEGTRMWRNGAHSLRGKIV